MLSYNIQIMELITKLNVSRCEIVVIMGADLFLDFVIIPNEKHYKQPVPNLTEQLTGGNSTEYNSLITAE